MQLDFLTTFIITGVMIGAISLSILVFSFTRKENLQFLWGTAAGLLFSAGYILAGLRGIIPDFYSIIVFNILVILGLLSFCELYSRMLDIRPAKRYLLLLVPLTIAVLFSYYTFVSPDYTMRVILFNTAVLIPVTYILTVLYLGTREKPMRSQRLASIPFIIFTLIAITRLIHPQGIQGGAFTLPFDFLLNTFYMITSVWATMSSILLVGNRLQAQLEYAASIDPLTQTMNRRYLQESLMKELDAGRRKSDGMSIILCDIDHFKEVNDTYGHVTGDAVLVHTVNLFRNQLQNDDILARYGGEEFLFVLYSTPLQAAHEIAERARAAVSDTPYLLEGKRIPITCSFGVACFDCDTDDYESLIQRADGAMYRSKREGRNIVTSLAYGENL